MTNTNNTELMVTSPVANGKSEPASFATIGNTAITGPADWTMNVTTATGSNVCSIDDAEHDKWSYGKTADDTTDGVFV